MRRQGLIVTINQLHDLIEELEGEFDDDSDIWSTDDNRKFQINIINKTPNCSDTWEIESHQVKKDEDDGSNVSSSGNPKQKRGKTNKVEQMPVDAMHLSNPVDNQPDDIKLNNKNNN